MLPTKLHSHCSDAKDSKNPSAFLEGFLERAKLSAVDTKESECLNADEKYDDENSNTRLLFNDRKIRIDKDDEVTIKYHELPTSNTKESNLARNQPNDFRGIAQKGLRSSKEVDQTVTVQKQKESAKLKQKQVIEMKKTNQPIFEDPSEQLPTVKSSKAGIEIPVNKKVQEIMTKMPLRERMVHLLPNAHQFTVSPQCQHLLRCLDLMDRTIEFMGSNRSHKVTFFQELRQNIKQSVKFQLDTQDLQQLLYLDDRCYELNWHQSQKARKYDLWIKIGWAMTQMDVEGTDDKKIVRCLNNRKEHIREKMVHYFLQKEQEFMEENNVVRDYNQTGWVTGFEPSLYSIPLQQLPSHPLTLKAQLRNTTKADLASVRNPHLQSILLKNKEQSEVKSLSSADVASKIFSKKGKTANVEQEIYKLIQEKEVRMKKEAAQQEQQQKRMDKETIRYVCDEIFLLYLAKNVSNIFKVNLLDALKRKIRTKDHEIEAYLEEILKVHQVGFLKEMMLANKTKVIQINKSKLRDILNHFST